MMTLKQSIILLAIALLVAQMLYTAISTGNYGYGTLLIRLLGYPMVMWVAGIVDKDLRWLDNKYYL